MLLATDFAIMIRRYTATPPRFSITIAAAADVDASLRQQCMITLMNTRRERHEMRAL